MRWFSVAEMCSILSRFEKVFVLGDSMMRNLAVAFHVYLRGDLVHGGRTTWLQDPPGVDCTCRGPFEQSKCGFHSVVTSRVVYQEASESMLCPDGMFGGFECACSIFLLLAPGFADSRLESMDSWSSPSNMQT